MVYLLLERDWTNRLLAHVWNGLPSDVSSAPSLVVFGRRLKTTFASLLQCCLAVTLFTFIVVL